MKEIRNKKIINGIIGVILFFVILFGGFWLIDNLFTKQVKAQTVENVSYSDKNLAVPDLEYSEYLGDGVYLINNAHNITLTYNVYNGIWSLNGTTSGIATSATLSMFTTTSFGVFTSSYIKVGGITTSNDDTVHIRLTDTPNSVNIGFNTSKQVVNGYQNNQSSSMYIRLVNGVIFNNFQFKLQIEKGDLATDYTVPLQPYLSHEKGDLDFTGIDYRDLEIGDSLLINNKVYYPLVNNNNYGLSSIDDWLDFIEMKNVETIILTEIEIQAPITSSFYFYVDEQLTKLADGVFKMKLVYDVNEGLFILELYARNQVMIYTTDLYGFDYSIGYMDWYYSPETLILTDITSLGSYSQGYRDGSKNGYDDGLDDGYDLGYEVGRDEYGYENVNGAWLTADTWGNIEYERGYYYGDIDGYANGYEVGRDEYGEYFQAGSPSGMSGWYGFQDGYDLGLDDGWDDGYDYGLIDSPNNNFGNMISTILLGVGTVLGIELLPNITIGAIIAVPIVFGIIAFVLGRKKD